jgi:hypothetical protein
VGRNATLIYRREVQNPEGSTCISEVCTIFHRRLARQAVVATKLVPGYLGLFCSAA